MPHTPQSDDFWRGAQLHRFQTWWAPDGNLVIQNPEGADQLWITPAQLEKILAMRPNLEPEVPDVG